MVTKTFIVAVAAECMWLIEIPAFGVPMCVIKLVDDACK